MGFLLVGLVWLLNLAISAWSAYAVGKSWVEARAAGGWPRVMCWSGAVMSASGFSWCYLLLVALGAYHLEAIDETQMIVAFNLGYILLIPGILLSGLLITLNSWGRAFRRGGFLNYGTAVYNTYAQIHNTYGAIASMGEALRSVQRYFGNSGSRGDKEGRNGSGWVVVILLVAATLAAGILTTTFIIWKVAATTPLPPTPQQFEDSAGNVENAR